MDEKLPLDVQAEADAVARLRAADPAAQANLTEADLATLRAAVDERRGAVAGVRDELAARRHRRLASWPARAAAVAAVALVVGGGGGYALGAAGDGEGTGAALTAEAPISLSAPEAAAEGGDMAGAAMDGAVAPGPARMAGADAYWGGWYGRTVFSASGLSDAPATGRAWALDAGAVSAEAAAAAAAALGVGGEPRLEYGSWVVGPSDGSGATVSLNADGLGSLSYWDPTMETWACAVTLEGTGRAGSDGAGSDGAGSDSAGSDGAESALVDPVAPEACEQRDLGDAPTGDAAAGVLRDRMSALGVDPAGFEVVVEESGDPAYSYVVAHQVVDGQRTGLTWNASLTGAGVSGLYGFTAALVDLGEYDVISPAAAVERLNDPRFGAGMSGPLRMAETAALPVELAEPDGTPPSPLTPGSSFAWPVQFVTITQARLGVAVVTGVDGATALAPSYELTAADGSVWSVIAVDDAQLQFATD